MKEILDYAAQRPGIKCAVLAPNELEAQLVFHRLFLASGSTAKSIGNRIINLPNGSSLLCGTYDEGFKMRADCYWVEFGNIRPLSLLGSEVTIVNGEIK